MENKKYTLIEYSWFENGLQQSYIELPDAGIVTHNSAKHKVIAHFNRIGKYNVLTDSIRINKISTI